jgi:hypothetical protein
MQQNNVLAAIVAVAKKKETICYSGYPPEINKFRVKTFQAAQRTHNIFFTLNPLCKINDNFNICVGTMNTI